MFIGFSIIDHPASGVPPFTENPLDRLQSNMAERSPSFTDAQLVMFDYRDGDLVGLYAVPIAGQR